MADNPFQRYLDAGVAFTEMTQQKAEAIVQELLRAGEVQSGQVQATVTEVLEKSRRNTEALVEQVIEEIRERASSLGFVTQDDLGKLVDQLKSYAPRAVPAKRAVAAAAPAKKKAGAKAR